MASSTSEPDHGSFALSTAEKSKRNRKICLKRLPKLNDRHSLAEFCSHRINEDNANTHANIGWEQFTDVVIKTISEKKEGVVFLVWGEYAQEKIRLIDPTKHHILKAEHPSALTADRGFFGCKHFSKTNQYLMQRRIDPIDWQL